MKITTEQRIAKLPLDKHSRPVPYFVAWPDGKPDFRIIDDKNIIEAIRFSKCWICGQTMGANRTFVIGPMCAVNRISSEPPNHSGCAEYAATHCPFLTRPDMHRRDRGLENTKTAGVMIMRNPGVTLLWTTKEFNTFRHKNDILFRIGDPLEIHWYREGRKATGEEIIESLDSGMPELRKEATTKEDHEEIDRLYKSVMELIP